MQMSIKEVQKELSVLEDKCIVNVESNFDEFVLIDLIEVGKVEYLIDKTDRYNYWLSNAIDINSIIDELIHDFRKKERETIKKLLLLKALNLIYAKHSRFCSFLLFSSHNHRFLLLICYSN